MASFSGILKKMFGSKAERDLKQLQPILNKVLESYQRIDKLTDDQLREESGKIRQTIADRIRDNAAGRYKYFCGREGKAGYGGRQVSKENR